jgi:CHAD domain-containing protein
MPVGLALQTILRHNLTAMLAHQELARDGSDIEGVHQMRVSVRRMRSALSLFRNGLERDQVRAWREEMRWLAGQLGRARDLDVFISEGLADVAGKLPLTGEEALRELALAKRAAVYAEDVRPLLNSERYQRFCADFPRWIEEDLAQQQHPERKTASRLACPMIARARKLLDKQERKVLDLGRSIARDDTPAMHQLRIECKKLRYAAEFFRPLFPGMDKFIARMKGIQDVLGVMNDLALTQGLLDTLLSERSMDAPLQRYAGALIGWRSYHFQQLLADFDTHWEALVAARRPWWDQQPPQTK